MWSVVKINQFKLQNNLSSAGVFVTVAGFIGSVGELSSNLGKTTNCLCWDSIINKLQLSLSTTVTVVDEFDGYSVQTINGKSPLIWVRFLYYEVVI